MDVLNGQRGFTLLELTVVVAIVVALAAVVIPMVGQAKQDGQVADILQVIDRLRTATMKFHADTGTCATEYGSSLGDEKHQLSKKPPMKGWKGPYLDAPLGREDNPFGGYVNVYADLGASACGGFDLVGRGSVSAVGIGNFVRVSNISEDLAQHVDASLDQGLSGDWKRTGRVQWRAGKLDVFLLDVDGK